MGGGGGVVEIKTRQEIVQKSSTAQNIVIKYVFVLC